MPHPAVPSPAVPNLPGRAFALEAGHRSALGAAFESGGEHYDAVRPGYPDGRRGLHGPAGATDAVDVGAGTGIFTALLVARGLRTTAVDPSADMLAALRARLPGVPAVAGHRGGDRPAGGGRRRRRLRPGLALGGSARGKHRGGAPAAPRRNAGAGLEPVGRFRPLGAPAGAHHARRGRAPARIRPPAGAGVRPVGVPRHLLGGHRHPGGAGGAGEVAQLLPARQRGRPRPRWRPTCAGTCTSTSAMRPGSRSRCPTSRTPGGPPRPERGPTRGGSGAARGC